MVSSGEELFKDGSPEKPSVQAAEKARPMLSSDFYMQLLDPPACIAEGVCDGCGRCEH